jgi:hypothetical protein
VTIALPLVACLFAPMGLRLRTDGTYENDGTYAKRRHGHPADGVTVVPS